MSATEFADSKTRCWVLKFKVHGIKIDFKQNGARANMKNSQKKKDSQKEKKKETDKKAREKQKVEEKAKKRAEEEVRRKLKAEEKAWKEAERLSEKQAEKERKEENERRKKREKLVRKLGTQQPGQYIVKVESQHTELIGRIESRLKQTKSLEIVYSGGSTEGIQLGIRLDQENPILLNITDLPQVAKAELKNNIIWVKPK